jgi:hypothetical protein
LTVTDWLFVPPPLVAEHVKVTPEVSVVTLLVPQPDWEVIVESGSVTVQVTVTLLLYQPLFPRVPLTFGVITGGVESDALKCAYSVRGVAVSGVHVLELGVVPDGVSDQ